MKDHNLHRLDLITGRYAARRGEKAKDSRDGYERAFREVRDAVIRPVMEEIAEALRSRGHAAAVAIDLAQETPSVELSLGIAGVPPVAGADRVTFSVIARRDALEVLAFLTVKPPPMDIVRFAQPDEITRDEVEQLVIDAVEHIFACRSV